MKRIYKNEGQTDESLDSLFIYSVLGIMIGARLGHVIFYQPELFKEDFFSIFLPFSFKGGSGLQVLPDWPVMEQRSV
jgi:phosphatidylglycerol:prolipoprotein diacylglycerol transferase